MKANELRLGNWVKVEFDYEVVKAINETTLWCALGGKGEGCMQLHSDVSPIFLDERWLLKLGFVSNAYQDRYELKNVHIECNKTNGFLELYYLKTGIDIKYVHQLQNLYFALTGEELTINN